MQLVYQEIIEVTGGIHIEGTLTQSSTGYAVPAFNVLYGICDCTRNQSHTKKNAL